MNIIAIIGLVSGVISIISIFIPDNFRSKKLVIVLIIIITAILSGIIVNQNDKLARIKQVSRAANELINLNSGALTTKGFVQASLTFLEQNKDMYPDSYERAKLIYEKMKNDKFSMEDVHTSYELRGLIKGIAILNDQK